MFFYCSTADYHPRLSTFTKAPEDMGKRTNKAPKWVRNPHNRRIFFVVYDHLPTTGVSSRDLFWRILDWFWKDFHMYVLLFWNRGPYQTNSGSLQGHLVSYCCSQSTARSGLAIWAYLPWNPKPSIDQPPITNRPMAELIHIHSISPSKKRMECEVCFWY